MKKLIFIVILALLPLRVMSVEAAEPIENRTAYNDYANKIWTGVMRAAGVPNEDFKDTEVTVGFNIDRNGRVSDVAIEKSSGLAEADQWALNSVASAADFGKLPIGWPADVHVVCRMRIAAWDLSLAVTIPTFDAASLNAESSTRIKTIDANFVLALGEKLKISDLQQQKEILVHLRALGPQAAPATRAIAAMTKSPNQDVRIFACLALEKIGPGAKEAIPELVALLGGVEDSERIDAAKALGAIGSSANDAIPALLKAMNSDNGELRATAALALKQIGPAGIQAAVPVLIKNLSDFHCISVDVLPEFGADAIPGLIDTISNSQVRDARRHAAQTLRRMPTTALPALRALRLAIHDRDEDLSEEAIDAIAAIGPSAESALPDLIQALKVEGVIRSHSVDALAAFGSAAAGAIPALNDLLKATTDEEDRRQIQDAIHKIQPPVFR